VLLEKIITIQLVKKFHTFLEGEVSLPCSQEPDTEPYLEPDDSN